MKPTIAQFLLIGAQASLTRIAPQLGAQPTLASHVSTLAMMSMFAAQELDRAADTLARENGALRALFVAAAERALPTDLKARLLAAGRGADASLRISALEAANAELMAVLIELHAFVERDGAAWARELDKAIWILLRDGARARALSLPGG